MGPHLSRENAEVVAESLVRSVAAANNLSEPDSGSNTKRLSREGDQSLKRNRPAEPYTASELPGSAVIVKDVYKRLEVLFT